MKNKSIISKLIHSDNGNRTLLVIVSIFISIFWFSFQDISRTIGGDTGTYFTAGKIFASGEIDYLRTPVYPVLCHFALTAFGDYALHFLVAINFLVFYFSIIVFHKTLSLNIKNKTISFVLCALYAWSIPMLEHCYCVHTESLTISGIIFLIHLISLILLGKANKAIMIGTPLLLCFLIFLRPFNLCFVPILIIIFAISHYKGVLKNACAAYVSAAIATVLVFGYCYEFKQQHGTFELSQVSSLNRFEIYEKSQKVTAPHICRVETISINNIPIKSWIWEERQLAIQQTDSVNNEAILDFASSRISQIDVSSFMQYPNTRSGWGYNLSFLYSLDLGTIYLLILIATIFELYCLRKRHYKHSVLIMLMFIACYATIFTTIWGSADCQHNRLMLPMYPCLCILAALIFDKLNIKLKPKAE